MLYICNMVAILLRDKKQWLSRSTSVLLLLLFALSITPKKTLHDWLVHHQDETSYQQQATPSIVKSGFHCDTDNNVAESPSQVRSRLVYPNRCLPLSASMQQSAIHFIQSPPFISRFAVRLQQCK